MAAGGFFKGGGGGGAWYSRLVAGANGKRLLRGKAKISLPLPRRRVERGVQIIVQGRSVQPAAASFFSVGEGRGVARRSPASGDPMEGRRGWWTSLRRVEMDCSEISVA